MQGFNQICSDCKSDKFVWDWANGDVVCTSCGLVNQERFIDDRFGYKEYEDHEYKETKIIDKKVDKVVSTINSVMFNGMIDDTNMIAEKIQHTYENSSKTITTADVVAGVYSCQKGLTAQELCLSMNVKPKKFWKSVKNDVIWDQRLLDIIKRLVSQSVKFEKKQEWPVIKCTIKIIERIKKSSEVQNIKTDKLAISLIYIACQCENIIYEMKDFVKHYRISSETLKRHEHIIQTILKKNK
jgi:transcription initiation factor TFIIIB Brf1 subunit/transcription initiation factor TFIIB